MATIVSLHAHPDDEALLCGGWLAQRAALGDRVVLVVATDGDAGLAAPDQIGPGLGDRRRRELLVSADALGVARVVVLGYRDSGMAAAPTDGPGRFVDVPVETAAREVAAILDEEDAELLTGYDANGGYGHPDHVQVHRVARAAQAYAHRRPVLCESTLDRTWFVRAVRLVRPFARLLPGLTVPGDDVFSPRSGLTRCDVRAQWTAKRAALVAHASQAGGGIRTIGVLLALPAPVGRRLLGTEWFLEVP